MPESVGNEPTLEAAEREFDRASAYLREGLERLPISQLNDHRTRLVDARAVLLSALSRHKEPVRNYTEYSAVVRRATDPRNFENTKTIIDRKLSQGDDLLKTIKKLRQLMSV